MAAGKDRTRTGPRHLWDTLMRTDTAPVTATIIGEWTRRPRSASRPGVPPVKKKALIVAVALLVVALGAGWYLWSISGPRELRFPGIVEIQEVRLGSKIGGRVAKVLVKEGALLYPKQELVIFETPELETQRAQLQAM